MVVVVVVVVVMCVGLLLGGKAAYSSYLVVSSEYSRLPVLPGCFGFLLRIFVL